MQSLWEELDLHRGDFDAILHTGTTCSASDSGMGTLTFSMGIEPATAFGNALALFHCFAKLLGGILRGAHPHSFRVPISRRESMASS